MSKSGWYVDPSRDIEAEARAQGWRAPPQPVALDLPLPPDPALEVLTAPGPAQKLEIICRQEDSMSAMTLVAMTFIRRLEPVQMGMALAALKDSKLPAEIADYTMLVDDTLPQQRARYRLPGDTEWRDLTIQDQT